MQEDRINLTKYILIFSAIYAGIFGFVNVLLHGFNIDVGSGANMAMLIGAGYGAAINFVNDNERAPDKKESNILALFCFLSTAVISVFGTLILTFLVMSGTEAEGLKELLSSLSPVIWVIIFSVIGVFYFLILKLIFGWGANKYASKKVKNEM
jgi:hypothetical protein